MDTSRNIIVRVRPCDDDCFTYADNEFKIESGFLYVDGHRVGSLYGNGLLEVFKGSLETIGTTQIVKP